MKNRLPIVLALAWTAAGPAAGDEIAVEPAEQSVQVLQADMEGRTLKIRDQDGNLLTVAVPDEISNLDEVKEGARVRLRFITATAVAIARDGETLPRGEGTARLAPAGGSPATVPAPTREIAGRIRDIEPSFREITLEPPDGPEITVTAREGLPGFDELRIGDTVTVRYTEAVALGLKP